MNPMYFLGMKFAYSHKKQNTKFWPKCLYKVSILYVQKDKISIIKLH